MLLTTKVIDSIIDQLATREWAVIEHFISDPEVARLLVEEKRLWESGAFNQAKVGPGPDKQLRPEIRTDRIHWLDEDNLAAPLKSYWNIIDRLRLRINREFYTNLDAFEAHFAVYPPGSYYRRHLDQFRSVRKRIISCILYLNRTWSRDDGGQLRIYSGSGSPESFTDIFPAGGTFVCFRSDSVYHEVLPSSTRDRVSLTGWLKKN